MASRRAEALDGAVWRASGDIARGVTDASCAPELGQIVMDALDGMVGCDLGSIITVAPGEPWAIVGEISDNRFLRDNYWRYVMEMSPEEIRHLARGFVLDTEVFAPRRRERLGVFREFLDPNGLRCAAVANWVNDGRAWGVGLTRTVPSFSHRALARLNAVLPHVKAALRARSWLADQAGEYPGAGSGGPWALTPAQERTMSLVVRGLTNNEVAELLGTSANTVRNTLVDVFKKVGVSRRSELAFIVRSGACANDVDPRHIRDELAHQRRFVATIATRSND
jgi:DNA-binding CsgD family transcriptional regulator